MSVPNASRYYRLPTRMKVQLFWMCAVTVAAGAQLVNLVSNRVTPKRQERGFITLEEQFPDGNIPEKIIEDTRRITEFFETASLHNTLRVPSPGETAQALGRELDVTRMGKMRRE